ncbi:FecR family protein [Pseudozobellia thermophila]|uniref:FecR family protein n=1 Tax=Pseudozobellia thermophila TaxID=192903 RepID=A0A1M6MVI4_9FLAO|nr:FecR family protein [Pseudozobellia thermophila]SHJ87481.1 FecR family protein [Pseudozobellia thermophila]
MIAPETENLIIKFINNQASISELEELENWMEDPRHEKLFKAYVKTNYAIDFNMRRFDSEKLKNRLLREMANEKKAIKLERRRKVMNYAAAAVVIGVFACAYFYQFNSPAEPIEEKPVELTLKNTIEPGTDKAILTLEDGSMVALDKTNPYDAPHAKSNGEQIVYKNVGAKPSKIEYNYLTIPRGGQFYIKLSDGTEVWLNSESRLKYPVSFRENETREVELVYGEAYFDVSPSTEHKGSKFKVLNKNQEIEVLGTEFNIKAYRDEAHIYTTLVEGSVTVGSGGQVQKLAPAQQSKLDIGSNTFNVYKVNVYNETSWKNGIFSFRDKPLKDIMKVISRWYDVDVVFENKELEAVTFKGVLGKNQDLQEILSAIKTLSIIENYEINEKKIILK